MSGSATPVIGWTLQARSAQLVRAPSATQYAVGDILTSTPASYVTFSNPLRPGGMRARITGVDCVVECSTGTIALPAFDLLLFEPAANIPAALASLPADNAALNVSAAAFRQVIGIFSFSATAWRNQAGGATSVGAVIYQSVSTALQVPGKPFVVADMSGTNGGEIRGLIQMQNTWNPGAVGYTLDFALDVDSD